MGRLTPEYSSIETATFYSNALIKQRRYIYLPTLVHFTLAKANPITVNGQYKCQHPLSALEKIHYAFEEVINGVFFVNS